MSTIDDELLTCNGESIITDVSESDEDHEQKKQRVEIKSLNNDNEQEMLRTLKERNRLCAKRTRLKKKIHLEYLESRVKTLLEKKAESLERLGEPPAEDAADILLSLKGDSSLNTCISPQMSDKNVSDNPSIDPESIHPSGLPMKLTSAYRREKAKIQVRIYRAKNKQRTKMLEKFLRNLEKEVDCLHMREINKPVNIVVDLQKIGGQAQIATNLPCQIDGLGLSITPDLSIGSPIPLSQLMTMGVPVASQSNGVLGATGVLGDLQTAKALLLQQLQHLQQQQRAVEQQLQQLQLYEQQQQRHQQQQEQALLQQQLHQTLLQHSQHPQQKLPLLQELLQQKRAEGGCQLSSEMPPLLLQEEQSSCTSSCSLDTNGLLCCEELPVVMESRALLVLP